MPPRKQPSRLTNPANLPLQPALTAALAARLETAPRATPELAPGPTLASSRAA
ncbi:MAG: hypothetical protein ABIK86_07425 [candidate division WOR-3 bacterium]